MPGILSHFSLPLPAEQVPATTIVCDAVTCASGTCNYTLRCVAGERGGRVAYSWTRKASGAVVSTGPILLVSLRPFEALPAVACTARHPASNSSRMVSPKDLCLGNPLGKRCPARGQGELVFALRRSLPGGKLRGRVWNISGAGPGEGGHISQRCRHLMSCSQGAGRARGSDLGGTKGQV